ncbi:MAG: hypothetical protein NVS9B10_02690 [Nevskia sp.]
MDRSAAGMPGDSLPLIAAAGSAPAPSKVERRAGRPAMPAPQVLHGAARTGRARGVRDRSAERRSALRAADTDRPQHPDRGIQRSTAMSRIPSLPVAAAGLVLLALSATAPAADRDQADARAATWDLRDRLLSEPVADTDAKTLAFFGIREIRAAASPPEARPPIVFAHDDRLPRLD